MAYAERRLEVSPIIKPRCVAVPSLMEQKLRPNNIQPEPVLRHVCLSAVIVL